MSGQNYFRKKTSRGPKATKQVDVSYMDVALLKEHLSEIEKIVPSRITGASARFQRSLTRSIKIARFLALLPFYDGHR